MKTCDSKPGNSCPYTNPDYHRHTHPSQAEHGSDATVSGTLAVFAFYVAVGLGLWLAFGGSAP